MNDAVFDPKGTAVLIVDLQNDFLHPDGAYGRSGTTNPDTVSYTHLTLPTIYSV